MWFMFGFISLISFSLYSRSNRLKAAWQGTPQIAWSGISYRYHIHRVEKINKSTALLIGIDTAAGYDFVLKRERILDRLARWLGLSQEYQCGDRDFDDAVYVVSDDMRVHEILRANPRLRQAVLGVVSTRVNGVKFKELRCNAGRLWVRFKTPADFREGSVRALDAFVCPTLALIARAMTSSPHAKVAAWRDPFVYKAAGILAISTGLALNGILQLSIIAYDSRSTLSTSQLMSDSLLWGGGVIVALLIATAVLLGRSSRTHLVLIELLLVGTFGATTTALAELRHANMEFDAADAVVIERVALSKHRKRHRRRPPKYTIDVLGWRDGNRGRVTIEVAAQLYDLVRPGSQVRISEKPGYLGYRWLQQVEIALPK